jgi:group I intron endonuclease
MIGKVYKITGKGKSYVGSTTQDLKIRLQHHFKSCKYRNNILYKFIREHGKEHFIIELIEEYPCETPKELRAREQHWMDQLKPELNMYRATPNLHYHQEYREEHKEEIRQKSNRFYQDHKDKILEKMTCECGCKITKNSYLRHLRTKLHKEQIEKL